MTGPQLIVVGTYGPHFPYIADGPRMDRLRPLVRASCRTEALEYHVPPLRRKVQEAPWEDIVELRCAYYALIEEMDQQLGQVYGAFRQHLNRTGRKGVFVYLSDHGDQIGYKGLYGKQTFFERSAKIPLVFAGDGVGREHILLFDTERDPGEEHNLAGELPQLCAQLGNRLERSPAGPDRRADYQDCLERYQLLSRLGPDHPEWAPDTFTASERVRHVRDPWRRRASQVKQGEI